MHKHLVACLVGLAILVMAFSPASAEKRVALVIGNSAYQHTAALKNPSNDAADMAAKLRQLGFEVIDGTDLSKREMEQRIRSFADKVAGADVGLFFYAGHGLQVDGRNFLAPVDAKLKSDVDLDFEAVELNLVLKQLERNSRVSLVFLDACRDNPLATRLADASRSLSIGRGLAQVERALGMMIAFATQPGNVALDGDGRNSPYTGALLRHIGTEGASINDVMIDVRNDVLKATDGRQIPWENSSLTGQFFFKPSAPKTADDESAETAAQIAALREEIARLQADQGARLKSQQEELEILQQKLQSATAKTAEPAENSETPPTSRVIVVEPSAGAAAASEDQADQTAEPSQTANLSPSKIEDVAGSPPAAAAPETPAIDQAALSRDIQQKLKEFDCYRGKIDGAWGRGTRNGVEGFNGIANLDLNVEQPEQATLDALAAWQGQHCPVKQIVRQKPAPAAPAASHKKTKVQAKKATPPKFASPGSPKQKQKSGSSDIETDTVHDLLRPAR